MSNHTYHTGFWVNRSKGPVLGATLTVSSKEGNAIIAFLALFVSFTGSSLWSVVCFALHQIRSSRAPQDGPYHQAQALLPNGLADISMALKFSQIFWAWRRKSRRIKSRSLLLILICLLHFGGITVASLFSSRIADSADNVLLSPGQNCGWYDLSYGSAVGPTGVLTGNLVDRLDSLALSTRTSIVQAQQYAKSCYDWLDGNKVDNTLNICDSYVIPSIASTINTTAACPFEKNACIGSAISLDSGLIDSDNHLGINAPAGDRVQIRRRLTCAAVPLEQRYSSPWLQTDLPSFLGGSHKVTVKEFEMGSPLQDGVVVDRGFRFANSTWAATNESLSISEMYTIAYDFSMFTNLSDSTFIPIPDFAQKEKDLSMISIGKNVAYTHEIKDPVFKADMLVEMNLGAATVPFWISNSSVGTIGCTEQYQVCTSSKCTDPGGIYEISDANGTVSKFLGLNDAQTSTLSVIWRALFVSRAEILFMILGSAMVRASEHVALNSAYVTPANEVPGVNLTTPSATYRYSTPVNDNQWQLEAQNMQNLALALVQNLVVGYAAAPIYRLSGNTSTLDSLIRPTTQADINLCGQQKVRSLVHTSFNVFGLAFLIGTGSVIMILAKTIPELVSRAQLKEGTPEALHRRDEWRQDNVLQLLRYVSEDQNPGAWAEGESTIPLTIESGKKFSMKWGNVETEHITVTEKGS